MNGRNRSVDRKKAYGHTHILDIVESKIRGKAGKSKDADFD